ITGPFRFLSPVGVTTRLPVSEVHPTLSLASSLGGKPDILPSDIQVARLQPHDDQLPSPDFKRSRELLLPRQFGGGFEFRGPPSPEKAVLEKAVSMNLKMNAGLRQSLVYADVAFEIVPNVRDSFFEATPHSGILPLYSLTTKGTTATYTI